MGGGGGGGGWIGSLWAEFEDVMLGFIRERKSL